MKAVPHSIVQEFVTAYYKIFAYEPESVYKFYDDKAQIRRQVFEGKLSRPFDEVKEMLIPGSMKGALIGITNYSSCPTPFGTNVIVNGVITQTTLAFNQFFTLEKLGEKVFISADSLQIFDTAKSIEETNATLDTYQSLHAKK